MSRILVIEDDPNLSKIIRSYLERDQFDVLTSNRGDTGLEMALTENPDLILLDLNLPGLDGLDVASELRKEKKTPVIMVTSRVEESDRLIGFDSGADDYISKPFSPRELVARVKAVLRRAEIENPTAGIILIDDLAIDLNAHSVRISDAEIELTPTEFSLLAKLAGNPGRVFSRQLLIESLQGDSFGSYERSIDVHIKNLRNKLKAAQNSTDFIETVFGIGYRFTQIK
jgi:two-component system alkaline phosphatase synthesis response regulator PhoP